MGSEVGVGLRHHADRVVGALDSRQYFEPVFVEVRDVPAGTAIQFQNEGVPVDRIEYATNRGPRENGSVTGGGQLYSPVARSSPGTMEPFDSPFVGTRFKLRVRSRLIT